jgi:hypothetical protein
MNAIDGALIISLVGLLILTLKSTMTCARHPLGTISKILKPDQLPNYPGVSPCFLRALKRAKDANALVYPNVSPACTDTYELTQLANLVAMRIQAAAPPQALELTVTNVRSAAKDKDYRGNANMSTVFMVYDKVSNAAMEVSALVTVSATGDIKLVDVALDTDQIPAEPANATVRPQVLDSASHAPYKPVISPVI